MNILQFWPFVPNYFSHGYNCHVKFSLILNASLFFGTSLWLQAIGAWKRNQQTCTPLRCLRKSFPRPNCPFCYNMSWCKTIYYCASIPFRRHVIVTTIIFPPLCTQHCNEPQESFIHLNLRDHQYLVNKCPRSELSHIEHS